jgi:HTH-type transcriptional regulator/antitoxin HipB
MEQTVRTAKQIGNAIRRERRKLRLTQEQLGSKVKLRQATVSKLEAGEVATQLRTLLNVLTALNLEIVIQPRTTTSSTEIEDIF